MNAVLAIDPGPEESALLLYRPASQRVEEWAKLDNLSALAWLEDRLGRGLGVAIEMVASYGMPVGRDVFETVLWAGRFRERCWSGRYPMDDESVVFVYRREVKLHLCHSMRATDSNVRAALLDKWGGKIRALGRKAEPGPLYGVKGDGWAALGVAVTAAEQGMFLPLSEAA